MKFKDFNILPEIYLYKVNLFNIIVSDIDDQEIRYNNYLFYQQIQDLKTYEIR